MHALSKCGATKSSVVDSPLPKKEIPSAEDVSAMSVVSFYNLWTSRRENTGCRLKETVHVIAFRDKNLNGIIRSAQKRPVSSDEIGMVVNRIEQNL